MGWIRMINNLSRHQKEGLYRNLIPASIFHRININPLNFHDSKGANVVRFFCPGGDSACLVEIKARDMDEPVYSIQVSDSMDLTMMDWDFLIINDPQSAHYATNLDEKGRDTLFGWASRNLAEEQKAMDAGYFPGQTRKGMGCTREVIRHLDFFCRILGIKSVRLEALFYHNAVTYERMGYSYFKGYKMMKRINELFEPGHILYKRLNDSSPFRKREFAGSVRGRSWAIHDGILNDIEDDILSEGWMSPVMYRMLEKPRAMITFSESTG